LSLVNRSPWAVITAGCCASSLVQLRLHWSHEYFPPRRLVGPGYRAWPRNRNAGSQMRRWGGLAGSYPGGGSPGPACHSVAHVHLKSIREPVTRDCKVGAENSKDVLSHSPGATVRTTVRGLPSSHPPSFRGVFCGSCCWLCLRGPYLVCVSTSSSPLF
jgi:hypothetical protein